MKKIFVVFIILAFFAAPAFAAQALIGESGISLGGSTFTPSTKVLVAYESTATAYAAASKHLNGTYVYNTDSVSSTIDKTAADAGDPLTASDAPSLPSS